MQKPFNFAAAIAISFIALEITLRAFGWGDPPIALLDENIEYYPKPSTSYNRYGNHIEINSLGMRSREFDHTNPPQLHVSIFGDSIVYGNHRLDQSNTIATKLENKLRSTKDENTIVSAIAASSWGPQNIEEFFRKKGPFQGKYAVIVQSSHDRFDIIDRSGTIKPPYRLQKSLTATGDFILRIWEWIETRYGLNRKQSTFTRTEAIAITTSSLHRFIKRIKQSYKDVVLFYHVSYKQINSPVTDPAVSHFKKIANQNNVDFIDSTIHYKTQNCGNDIYIDNLHLSLEGTTCVTEVLYRWITTKQ